MLIPSSVPARARDMTEAQHRELGQFFERHGAHDACRRDPLVFALVLAGEKPAVDYSPSRWEFPNHPLAPYEGLLELCDRFNLSYRRIGPGVGNDWFIAPSSGRLALLPSTPKATMTTAWHRRLGVILGYPPEAIEFFIQVTGRDRTRPEDLVAAGQFTPEEIAYTRFVFYVHEDSIDGYKRAIETGQTVRRHLAALAKQWDLPTLDTIAEKVYTDGIRVFSQRADGHRASFLING